MQFDKSVYDRAGLKRADVQELFGVSRTTVQKWYTGGNVHPLIENTVEEVTALIAKAIEDGKLPFKDIEPQERPAKLQYILYQ